jgi:hypothetical protein
VDPSETVESGNSAIEVFEGDRGWNSRWTCLNRRLIMLEPSEIAQKINHRRSAGVKSLRISFLAITRGVELNSTFCCSQFRDIYYRRDCNASGCIYSARRSFPPQSFVSVRLSLAAIFIFICSVSV